ncbi:hypothetical protein [Nocardia wallacei]|uniref:Uncharacterized protein n=1 Tax=Nocardia wallacei TaxID=480035 RepID=A0A7G1KN12_9NOCA|nr:hypothetical protein [Nocardia wallacei]BCK56460.1 hypothetical protein NWFMUON74_42320 [Nocardia wallacei]
MTQPERQLHPVRSDAASAHVRDLTVRATRSGYRLVRAPRSPYEWRLLDVTDGAVRHAVPRLDDIEHWLNA